MLFWHIAYCIVLLGCKRNLDMRHPFIWAFMADHGLFSCFFGTVKLFWAKSSAIVSLSGKKAGSAENGINVIEIEGMIHFYKRTLKFYVSE